MNKFSYTIILTMVSILFYRAVYAQTDVNLQNDLSALKKEFEEKVSNLPGAKNLKLEYEIGYDPDEYRDPFAVPDAFQKKMQVPQTLLPSQSEPTNEPSSDFLNNPYTKYFIMEYKVRAIMWGVSNPKAMVLGPQGEILTIGLGYRLGREGGVVWKIKEGEVIILLPDGYKDFKNSRFYSLKLKEKEY